MKRLFSVIMITLPLFILLPACCLEESPKVDVVSGATMKEASDKVILPPPSSSYEVIGEVDGLKNYVIKYDHTLYRGGAPISDSAVESLKQLGIQTVISIAPSDYERNLCRENNLTLIEIPFEKTPGPSKANIEFYLNTIRNGTGPFYVHCHGGSHRGGVLGVAYRQQIRGWDKDKALVEYGRLGGDLLGDHKMLECLEAAQ